MVKRMSTPPGVAGGQLNDVCRDIQMDKQARELRKITVNDLCAIAILVR